MAVKLAEPRIVADWPCPFCSCLCDDLQLTVDGTSITAADNGCLIAQRRLAEVQAAGLVSCRIAGEPVERTAAIQRAAELLSQSRRPLIYGLSGVTVEAQRLSAELAERLGGVIDPSGSWNTLHALQSVGEATATLGEIRSRADLIVVWNANPVATHPRLGIRGRHPDAVQPRPPLPLPLGEGRGEGKKRTDVACEPSRSTHFLVSIDNRKTETSSLAEQVLAIRPNSDCDAANILCALASGLTLDDKQVSSRTGVQLTEWQKLAARLKKAKYAAIIYDGGPNSAAERQFVEALHSLVRELNEATRCVCLHLSDGENLVGAENVLAWQTGFSRAVDFARGFPRFDPAIYTAERLLERRSVDLLMIVGEESLEHFSDVARRHLQSIPTVVIDWRDTDLLRNAAVGLPIAVPGVAAGGTYFRCDGVPLALRPAIESQVPSDCKMLTEILSAIAK